VDDNAIVRDLQRIETDLKRLEAEYTMFFAGRLPRPPWETRNRVAALVRRMDREHIPNTGERFRFETLQARFAALLDLWDRAMRAREEGRPGPFARGAAAPPPPGPTAATPSDGVVRVAAFRDPASEVEKLQDLYEALVEARRQVGEGAPPFDRFAALVQSQVATLRAESDREVAFRVAIKDGRVTFTARALKGGNGERT
jgi:hypothetical protein